MVTTDEVVRVGLTNTSKSVVVALRRVNGSQKPPGASNIQSIRGASICEEKSTRLMVSNVPVSHVPVPVSSDAPSFRFQLVVTPLPPNQLYWGWSVLKLATMPKLQAVLVVVPAEFVLQHNTLVS